MLAGGLRSIGGVQPGLAVGTQSVVTGPEPIMGVQQLEQLEQGKLVDGTDTVCAVSTSIGIYSTGYTKVMYMYYMCNMCTTRLS